jgi:hypothetical protein
MDMKIRIVQLLAFAAVTVCAFLFYATAQTPGAQRWGIVMAGLGLVGVAYAGWEVRRKGKR